jgi:hypothetical protein
MTAEEHYRQDLGQLIMQLFTQIAVLKAEVERLRNPAATAPTDGQRAEPAMPS